MLRHSQLLWVTTTVLTSIASCGIVAESCESVEQLRLDDRLSHLRISGPREWSEFPEHPNGSSLEIKFAAMPNRSEQTIRLRQQDVKQPWRVLLNGKELGRLKIDENDMIVYFSVPANALVAGENLFRIAQDERNTVPDDIRVGEIVLDSRPSRLALADGSIEIDVRDADSKNRIPARITILTESGALQTVDAQSSDHLAVRPGLVYTSTGQAKFGIPAGQYKIVAGRGFEYSVASTTIEVAAGDSVARTMEIRREVPTPGTVACDTHVHTLTHSGHGDATIEERVITLAGEGIELPIATDHNVHIDYEPLARRMNVRQFFTPIVGNEVTTTVGHFNVFPTSPDARAPNARLTDWRLIFDDIYRTPRVKAVILNHARDLHGGTRPFGPKLHNAIVGENLEGRSLRANAMEVVNSSATQTDVLQLFHDWMAMLNRGRLLTPVGSSDSHDVGRHFVGQGRTYIRTPDHDAGNIDVDGAINSFLQGRVMVSYGLLAELTVNDKYGSGELVPVSDETVHVTIRVLGPHWIQASQVALYANGKKVREQSIDAEQIRLAQPGVKWSGEWTLPRPNHDLHLVAIAMGPGVREPYWKTAKPYQPTSADWQPHVIACSGAVWLDADGDGRKTPAFDYAQRIVSQCHDLPTLLTQLERYDEAVTAQAANLWHRSGRSLTNPEFVDALNRATPAVRAGFQAYIEAWQSNERAR